MELQRKLIAMFTALGIATCLGCTSGSSEQPKAQTSGQGKESTDKKAAAAADKKTEEVKPAAPSPALLDPSLAKDKAPDKYKVKLVTTKGDATIEVTRDWAPNGADRFFNLVKIGYFTDVAFFRVVREPRPFMVQFGIHGDPQVNAKWRQANIQDDPVKQSNQPGHVTFATAGPNTRTTQLFISYGDNSFLDGQGFSPIGRVTMGMDVVNSLYAGYGEGAPQGFGPNQGLIQTRGNKYLKESFPNLDYIKSAAIVE